MVEWLYGEMVFYNYLIINIVPQPLGCVRHSLKAVIQSNLSKVKDYQLFMKINLER
jgi:hypothetical protein